MPNCFTLTKINEEDPTGLSSIDNELRHEFNEPDDNKNYLYSWFDTIGLGLACGNDWDKMKDVFKDDPDLLKVISYMETRYTYSAWYETK